MNTRKKTTLFAALALLMVFSNIFAALPVHAAPISVELHPDHGPIDTIVIVNGTADTSNGLVQIFWESEANLLTETHANDIGYYEDTITIPPCWRGSCNVIVKDFTSGNTASAPFSVEPEITIVPIKGPYGVYIEVSGKVVASSSVDVIFYASDSNWQKVIENVPTNPDGSFSTMFMLPDETPGTYEIRVYQHTKTPPLNPEASANFDLTEQPSITLTPNEDLPGTVVTVHGINFPPNVGIEILFDDVLMETTSTDEDGMFTCEFTVPGDAEPGKHTVEADDTTYDTHGAAIFEVDELMIGPRLDEYFPGDVVSFYANSTFLFNLEVYITDPYGIPFYGFDVASDEWVRIDGRWIVPYVVQEPLIARHLPNDAPQGNWVWNATNLDTGLEVTSGTFLVKEPQTFETIMGKLSDLDVKIDAIITTTEDTYAFLETMNGTMVVKLNEILEFLEDVNGTITDIGEGVVTIQTNQGTILVAVEAVQDLLETMNVTLTGIEGDVGIIKTDVGEIKVDIAALDLSVLNTMLTNIHGNVTEIKTTVGSISVDTAILIDLAEDINARVIGIEGDIATINTDIGLLGANISVIKARITSIQDDVVTIKTSLGTLQADVDVLNAMVTQIKNDTATIKTTLGELEGTVLDIEGDVATVLVPGIGTIQADISDLSDTVSTGIGGLGGLSSTILLIVAALSVASTILSVINLITIRRLRIPSGG